MVLRVRDLLRYLIQWTSGEAYIPGPAAARNTKHVGDVLFRFHNVQGLSDRIFREYYLGRARAHCDVLALAETNCPDERTADEWSKAWRGSAGVFWALNSRGNSRARGMAIMFSSALGNVRARVLWSDPSGRGLAVAAVIRNVPTVVVAFHADNTREEGESGHDPISADEMQARSFMRMRTAVPLLADHKYILLMDANNTLDPHMDKRTGGMSGGIQTQNHPKGVAALRAIMADWKVADVFRTLNPNTREYTHSAHVTNEVARQPTPCKNVSHRRLDRVLVSTNMLGNNKMPRASAVRHLHPTDRDLAALRYNGSNSKWSDHKAVEVRITYTSTVKTKHRWHLPAHLLKRPDLVDAKWRVQAKRALEASGSARDRLTRYLVMVEKDARDIVSRETNEHRRSAQQLYTRRAESHRLLGDGHGSSAEIDLMPPGPDREARRMAALAEQKKIYSELEALVRKEQQRWMDDRGYEDHIYGDTCWRGFFEDTRTARVYSHIEWVRGNFGKVHRCTGAILQQARRYFCAAGSIFNLRQARTPERDIARERLLRALRDDGKCLREHDRAALSLTNTFTPERVQQAINELSENTAPGLDGWTAGFFKVVGMALPETSTSSPSGPHAPSTAASATNDSSGARAPSALATLLALVYQECATEDDMLDAMKKCVVSLIYKDKGERYNLKYYRPIAVSSILYRIMAKTMVIALRPLLPQLVSSAQGAFQKDELISDATRLTQDVISYCNNTGNKGLLVMCDQDNAYPRVDWDYLQAVMTQMGIHDDFRALVRTMYKGITLQFKINGVIDQYAAKASCATPCSDGAYDTGNSSGSSNGDGPHDVQVSNGLAQGDPLSPVLYLLCIQGLISLVTRDAESGDARRLRGIPLPPREDSRGGPSTRALISAFADDLCLYLQDEQQLPRFRELLKIYEQGSGAKNSWEKTFALRLGALRLSNTLPSGWIEGRDINFIGAAQRYLGIFLGAPVAVANEWERRTTKRVRDRYNLWRERGRPTTLAGCNVVIRNSVLAQVWYLVEHQVEPTLPKMMEAWRKLTWHFMAGGSYESNWQSPRIQQLTLIQDYTETGTRAQDIELHTRAIQIRKVRRIAEQGHTLTTHLIHHWLAREYGHLGMGRRLAISSCDFLRLNHQSVPFVWRVVFKAWGSLRGLRPSVGTQIRSRTRLETQFVREFWSLAEVMMEPIFYNPNLPWEEGWAGLDAAVWEIQDRRRAPHCMLLRSSIQRCERADRVYALSLKFAALGITHVGHLIRGWKEGEALTFMTWLQLRERCGRRGPPCTRAQYDMLMRSVPPQWHRVLESITQLKQVHMTWHLRKVLKREPLPEGSWVQRRSDNLIGQLAGGNVPRWYEVTRANRLREVASALGATVRRTDVQHVHVWIQQHLAHSDIEEEWRARDTARQPPPTLIFGGVVLDWGFLSGSRPYNESGINLGHWQWDYGITDRTRPPVSVGSADVHHLYHLQLSHLFTPLRTFDWTLQQQLGTSARRHTSWVDMLDLDDDVGNSEYEIDRITAQRRVPGRGMEYRVRWRGYSAAWDTWEPDGALSDTSALRDYLAEGEEVSNTDSSPDPDPNITLIPTQVGNRGGQRGQIRAAIFGGIRGSGLDRKTLDVLYHVWADAFPIGNNRCQKTGVRKGKCDACLVAFRTAEPETTRHAHLECPLVEAFLDLALRAAVQTVETDAGKYSRLQALSPRAAVHEFRRLLVTGLDAGSLRQENGLDIRGGVHDSKPWRAWIGAVHSAISRRRLRNTRNDLGSHTHIGTHALYVDARASLMQHIRHTRRRAYTLQEEIRLTNPDWDQENGPVAQWVRTWVQSRWATVDGDIRLPQLAKSVRGAAAATATWKLRLHVATYEGEVRVSVNFACFPDLVELGARRDPARNATPTDIVIYSSGGCNNGCNDKAGWAWIAVKGGDGDSDSTANIIAEAWGPVELQSISPVFLGAQSHTSESGQLSAVIEALEWVHTRNTTSGERILLRPTWEDIVHITSGTPPTTGDHALRSYARTRYSQAVTMCAGKILWAQIPPHTQSAHRWCNRVVALVTRGETGERGQRGEVGDRFMAVRIDAGKQWDHGWVERGARVTLRATKVDNTVLVEEQLSPLEGGPHRLRPGAVPGDVTALSALETDPITRVLRAEQAGANPLLVLNLKLAPPTNVCIQRAYESIRQDIIRVSATHGQTRTQWALRIIRDAYNSLQTRDGRLAAARWREAPRTLRCPIDVAALKTFADSDTARVQRPPAAPTGQRRPRPATVQNETLAFLKNLRGSNQHHTTFIDIQYQWSPLGRTLVGAGHITGCRDMAQGREDPFKHSKILRCQALSKFGFDFDDAGSWPRSGAHFIGAGQGICKYFIRYREAIMAAAAAQFFPRATVAEARNRIKHLISILDGDGSVATWQRMYDLPVTETISLLVDSRDAASAAVAARYFPNTETAQAREYANDLLSILDQGGPVEAWQQKRGLPVTGSVIFSLGQDAAGPPLPEGPFDFAAYIRVQPRRTAWLAQRLPHMLDLVRQFQVDTPRARPTVTTKNYVFQDEEARSCQAKRQYASENGARTVNLQWDGIVIQLPNGHEPDDVAQEMGMRTSLVQGYPQPVVCKPMVPGRDGITRLTTEESDGVTLGIGADLGREMPNAEDIQLALLQCVHQAGVDGFATTAFDVRLAHPMQEGAPTWSGWRPRVVTHLRLAATTEEVTSSMWGMAMRAARGYVVLDSAGGVKAEGTRQPPSMNAPRDSVTRHQRRRAHTSQPPNRPPSKQHGSTPITQTPANNSRASAQSRIHPNLSSTVTRTHHRRRYIGKRKAPTNYVTGHNCVLHTRDTSGAAGSADNNPSTPLLPHALTSPPLTSHTPSDVSAPASVAAAAALMAVVNATTNALSVDTPWRTRRPSLIMHADWLHIAARDFLTSVRQRTYIPRGSAHPIRDVHSMAADFMAGIDDILTPNPLDPLPHDDVALVELVLDDEDWSSLPVHEANLVANDPDEVVAIDLVPQDVDWDNDSVYDAVPVLLSPPLIHYTNSSGRHVHTSYTIYNSDGITTVEFVQNDPQWEAATIYDAVPFPPSFPTPSTAFQASDDACEVTEVEFVHDDPSWNNAIIYVAIPEPAPPTITFSVHNPAGTETHHTTTETNPSESARQLLHPSRHTTYTPVARTLWPVDTPAPLRGLGSPPPPLSGGGGPTAQAQHTVHLPASSNAACSACNPVTFGPARPLASTATFTFVEGESLAVQPSVPTSISDAC